MSKPHHHSLSIFISFIQHFHSSEIKCTMIFQKLPWLEVISLAFTSKVIHCQPVLAVYRPIANLSYDRVLLYLISFVLFLKHDGLDFNRLRFNNCPSIALTSFVWFLTTITAVSSLIWASAIHSFVCHFLLRAWWFRLNCHRGKRIVDHTPRTQWLLCQSLNSLSNNKAQNHPYIILSWARPLISRFQRR